MPWSKRSVYWSKNNSKVIYAKCQRNVDGKLSQNTRTLYRLKTYLLMAKQRQYTRKHYRPLYRYNISKEESIDYQ